jgi:SH3-like domain-containing protein
MYKIFARVAFASFLFLMTSFVSANENFSQVAVVTNCDGTQVVRTAPGKFETKEVEKNLPGCFSPSKMILSEGSRSEKTLVKEVTNCSGLTLRSYSDGSYSSEQGSINQENCVDDTGVVEVPKKKSKVNLSHGPLLDLASTDIGNYRAKLLRDRGVRFADAVRSARMRREANMQSKTNAYLMRNDAVIVSGKETGWVRVQGVQLDGRDEKENIVTLLTQGKAKGFTAAKFLRLPNISDLVRINQADHAYWSDIARTKVARYVNVRLHPNHESKIVKTLPNNYPLYIVGTVDNWSQVRNDEGTIMGYIRSDYLHIDKAQRVDALQKGVR